MPRITIKTPGATPPPRANPADEDLDPTDERGEPPMPLTQRLGEFVSGRYANRKAKRRLQPPRNIAGRRG